MQFKDVVGHNEVKKHLIESVKINRISHAQLFLGAEGNGNFQLALAYAQYVNCENPTEEDSCGKCSSCVKYQNLQHPDLNFFYPTAIGNEVKTQPSSKKLLAQWIEMLSDKEYFTLKDWMNHIGAGERLSILNKLDSQDIIKSLSLKNFESKFKVVIIWWPEKMNIECSNKILKVLEEPNPNSLFLLVGHNTDELLATIISRVQIVKTNQLSSAEIRQGLLDKEGVPEDLADSMANMADGNFTRALELVNNPEGDEKFIDLFQTWMRLCYVVDYLNLEKWVDEIHKMGRIKQKDFLEYGLRIFRECMVYNYANPEMNKLHRKEEIFNAKFAKFIHGGNILPIMELFEHTHTSILRNAYAKIAFMNLSLKMCNLLKSKP